MLRRVTAILYTPENYRTQLHCFSLWVFTFLLFLGFTSRYGKRYLNLYSISLIFDVPRQFEQSAISLAEQNEQGFGAKKYYAKRSNNQKACFNRLFNIRAKKRLEAEELDLVREKGNSEHSVISKLVQAIPEANVDTTQMGLWTEKSRKMLEYFVCKLEKNDSYKSRIIRKGDGYIFVTSSVCSLV